MAKSHVLFLLFVPIIASELCITMSLYFQISMKLVMDQRCSHHILLYQAVRFSHVPLVPRMLFPIRSASNVGLYGLRFGEGMQQGISFAAHVDKTAYRRHQMSLMPIDSVVCYIQQDFTTRQQAAYRRIAPLLPVKNYSVWSL